MANVLTLPIPRSSIRKWGPSMLAFMCGVGAAHAATEVQINVNANHVLCACFLKALRSDHVTEMSREQLCQYDFMRRHAGSYFQNLGWQPVAGDPVALTMKISMPMCRKSLIPQAPPGNEQIS